MLLTIYSVVAEAYHALVKKLAAASPHFRGICEVDSDEVLSD